MLEKYEKTNMLMNQTDGENVRVSYILNDKSVIESYVHNMTGNIETQITPIEQYFSEEGYGYNDDGAWDRLKDVAEEIFPEPTKIKEIIFADESINITRLSNGVTCITTDGGLTMIK